MKSTVLREKEGWGANFLFPPMIVIFVLGCLWEVPVVSAGEPSYLFIDNDVRERKLVGASLQLTAKLDDRLQHALPSLRVISRADFQQLIDERRQQLAGFIDGTARTMPPRADYILNISSGPRKDSLDVELMSVNTASSIKTNVMADSPGKATREAVRTLEEWVISRVQTGERVPASLDKSAVREWISNRGVDSPISVRVSSALSHELSTRLRQQTRHWLHSLGLPVSTKAKRNDTTGAVVRLDVADTYVIYVGRLKIFRARYQLQFDGDTIVESTELINGFDRGYAIRRWYSQWLRQRTKEILTALVKPVPSELVDEDRRFFLYVAPVQDSTGNRSVSDSGPEVRTPLINELSRATDVVTVKGQGYEDMVREQVRSEIGIVRTDPAANNFVFPPVQVVIVPEISQFPGGKRLFLKAYRMDTRKIFFTRSYKVRDFKPSISVPVLLKNIRKEFKRTTGETPIQTPQTNRQKRKMIEGWSQFHRGNYGEALAIFNEIHHENPNNTVAHYWLTRSYHVTGNDLLAKNELKELQNRLKGSAVDSSLKRKIRSLEEKLP